VPRGKTVWGVLPQAIVSGGQVIGTWKVTRANGRTTIAIELGRKLSADEQARLGRGIDRYSRFVGMPLVPVVRSCVRGVRLQANLV
jgi:hypothetical protein